MPQYSYDSADRVNQRVFKAERRGKQNSKHRDSVQLNLTADIANVILGIINTKAVIAEDLILKQRMVPYRSWGW
jgi:hypothetical protein